MKKIKQRLYSIDLEKQALAVENFALDLEREILIKLQTEKSECRRFVATNGSDWAISKLNYFKRDKDSYEDRKKKFLEEELPKEICTKKERLNELKELYSHPEIITDKVSKVVELIADNTVMEIEDKLTPIAMEVIRIMNGFIPNSDITIENYKGYKIVIDSLANKLYKDSIIEANKTKKDVNGKILVKEI